jgi:hypothetical protein
MGLEHLYGRIVTVALGALLGVCALLATAKFVRSRARLLSPLVRAHGALFAVMMGAVAVTAIIASVKDPPAGKSEGTDPSCVILTFALCVNLQMAESPVMTHTACSEAAVQWQKQPKS